MFRIKSSTVRFLVARYGIWSVFFWPIFFLGLNVLTQYFQVIPPSGGHIWPHYIERQYVAAMRISGEGDSTYYKYYSFYITLLISLAYLPLRFTTALFDFQEEFDVLKRRVRDFRRKNSKLIKSEVSLVAFLFIFPIAGFWAFFTQYDFATSGLMGAIFSGSQNAFLCLELIFLSSCLYCIAEGFVSIVVMMRFPE